MPLMIVFRPADTTTGIAGNAKRCFIMFWNAVFDAFRDHMLQFRIPILWKMMLMASLFPILAQIHSAQVTAEQVKKILVEKAAFTVAELSVLDGGGTVVKLLPSKDKKQVAVCGVVRIQMPAEVSMAAFRESLTQKTNKSMVDGGTFSKDPVLADLSSLKLDDDDIEDLKKCEVAKCDLKLSAAMIKRFQTAIDWNAPESGQQAGRMYKQMLADYAADYLRRGDEALMQYDSRKDPVRLADEYRLLLSQTLLLGEFAPEFSQYIREFPDSPIAEVEYSLDWSRINFGLDPTITITHTSSYDGGGPDNSIKMMAAKQIYASRYIDSSFALTTLFVFRNGNGFEGYLIFTDHSRSGVLDGMFSGMKRRLVGEEAVERVTDVLSRAKTRLAAGERDRVTAAAEPEKASIISTVGRLIRQPLVAAALLALAILAIFIIAKGWRRRSEQGAE